MTLSSMVVSRDWQEVSVLECILGGLHMDVTVEVEAQTALERLSQSKIDAIIVDCDLEGSSRLFRHLQTEERRFNTVPLMIMGKRQCMASLDQTGAMFAFEKPISVEQAVRTLSAARCMILDGRLRYHRIGIEVPISMKTNNRTITDAHLINLSQGGMRIYTDEPLDAEALQITCELPGSGPMLNAQAEVVWHDDSGNIGVRFVKVPQQHQKALQLWLAQQFLAN
jgi:DNA-binding NarL/FixJ family response regulator